MSEISNMYLLWSLSQANTGEWRSGKNWSLKIRSFPASFPLVGSAGTWKPPYEAFDVLRVKIIKGSNWWASGERGCLLIIGQDKVLGRPNNWLKKKKTKIEICCKILCENIILKYGLKVH